MTEALRDPQLNAGSMAILQAFGLDQVLTGQDDAELWAAALARHWPAPSDPGMEPATLHFGLGRLVPDGQVEGVLLGRSGLEQLETWCFERVSDRHLRPVECPERAPTSFGLMLMGGGTPGLDTLQASLVSDYLDVSRPSFGQARALVHAGTSAPIAAGTGETRYWERAEDGTWVETDEVFARWLT